MTSWTRGRGLRVQAILAALGCALALAFAAPNFFSAREVANWPVWLPNQQAPLGIDLVGGTSLLFEMDSRDAGSNAMKQVRDRVREALRAHRVRYSDLRFAVGPSVVFKLDAPELRGRVRELLSDYAASWLVTPPGSALGVTIKATADGEISLTLNEWGWKRVRQFAVEDFEQRLHRLMKCLDIDDYRIVREQGGVRLTIRGLSELPHMGSRCMHI